MIARLVAYNHDPVTRVRSVASGARPWRHGVTHPPGYRVFSQHGVASGASMTTDLWRRIVADATVPAYSFGTRRAVPPLETLRRIRPRLRAAGITRLADVTGLDWIGIPVYQAIRPNSRTLSASQGKGLTRAQAQVSALMEALEGFHAERLLYTSVRETIGTMRRQVSYDPRVLDLLRPQLLHDA